MTTAPAKPSNGTVRPDAVTKYVGAGAYLVLMGLLFWIAASVASLNTRMAVIEQKVQSIDEKFTEKLRELKLELRHVENKDK